MRSEIFQTKKDLFSEVDIVNPFNNQLNLAITTFLESGYMYGCVGEYSRATQCFEGVLAICPDHVGGLLGLGNTLLMIGDTDRSEAAYRRVLEISPDDPAALAFLGELYLCTQRREEGKHLLESVWWNHPDSQVSTWAKTLLDVAAELDNEN